MTTLSVWAPHATSVACETGGARLPMARDGRGWWSCAADGVTEYAYVVDGAGPFPDPRSPWQPRGIDGPSRVVDHGAFTWTDDGWRGVDLATAVLYELHVGTFTPEGTFDGVAGKLDHLAGLGVDAIELLPVAEFSGDRGWGYDGVDLYAPHHAYGGPDGLKRLVDACHARGIGVVMDVVYNHLGPAGNHLSKFGPYFTSSHQTAWGDAVNFDGPESGEVRRFVVDNALMWLRDYHCDGLRLDAIHAIVDGSPVHVLEELATRVAELDPPRFLVAEDEREDARVIRSRDSGGYGIDAVWADDWHHALHTVLTGESSGYYAEFGSLDQLATAIGEGWVRRRPPDDVRPSQFVICTQNHDQVGNRAAGERLSQLVSADALRYAAALLLSSPFVPMLFMGEEWGASTPFRYFTDHADPALARAVSEGRRSEFREFGWNPANVPDPQDPATFEASKLQWDEVERDEHAALLEWYRALIARRRRALSERARTRARRA